MPKNPFRAAKSAFAPGAPTRRDCLRSLVAGAAAAAVLGGAPDSRARALAANTPAPLASARKRVLRVAHLTDIHVQPELKAAEGLAACLRHVQSQADKPDLILNTGDCIMDSMKKDRARTELQWQVWNSVWRAENALPVEHGIGNHDIWGWDKKRSKTSSEEGKWGKQFALDRLGLAKPYRSFDRGGWHFVVLDSVQPFKDGYTAKLDDEQFTWLLSDLASVNPSTPVLVMSHIPIFSITPVFELKADAGETPADPTCIGRASMHADYRKIKDLFKKHPNVRCAISGHIHLVDRVDYLGVTYLCGGAVSGNWWKGSRFEEADPGYDMLDLYDDGSVERQYVTYGWVAAKPEPAQAATVDQ